MFQLDPLVQCNRPWRKEQLQRSVLPGTNSEKGVTFGKCKDPTCAGGGTFLTYDLTCFVYQRTIPGGTIALSLKIAERREGLQTASVCQPRQPGDQGGGHPSLHGPIGTTVCHYSCVRAKR
ncbi:unnamed protein product, partial [Ectocarpus sp. 12 AP-2014]